MTAARVMVTGRLVDLRSADPGRRVIGAPRAESFPETLGNAANLSEPMDASEPEGQRSSARHYDTAGATATTPEASSDHANTAAAADMVLFQPCAGPQVPHGKHDNLPSGTGPNTPGIAVLRPAPVLPWKTVPGGTAAPPAPGSLQASSSGSGRTVSSEHPVGASQMSAVAGAPAPRGRLAGPDMTVRDTEDPQISAREPLSREGAQHTMPDRFDPLGDLRPEASASPVPKASARLSSVTRNTERAGAPAPGILGAAESMLSMGNTVSPAPLAPPAGVDVRRAAAGPVSGKAALPGWVDASARSAPSGAVWSIPPGAEPVPQNASGQRTSTTDPAVGPGSLSRPRSAVTIGPGRSAVEPVSQDARRLQTSRMDPTRDPGSVPSSQSAVTTDPGQSPADPIPKDASRLQASATVPTVDPGPMSSSQSAVTTGPGQSPADPIPRDASRLQTSAAVPTVDPGPMSSSQSPVTSGLGQPPTNPVTLDASEQQAFAMDPTGIPGQMSRSQSADTTGPRRSPTNPVTLDASEQQTSTTPPAADLGPMSRSHTTDPRQSPTNPVTQDASRLQALATDPTADPRPMSRPQAAVTPGSRQSPADPVAQNASGQATTDPTVDAGPMSQSADTIGPGQSAADPTSPQTQPTTGVKVVGNGLAEVDPAKYRTGDAGSGRNSGVRFAAAAVSSSPTAADAAGGFPIERPIATTAHVPLEDLPDQLFRHVAGSIDNAGNEVVLHLQPPELGDLTVRVVVIGREVSAWFGTPQVDVQQVISQALDQLHTELGNAGYTLGSTWVGADASDAGERGSRTPAPTSRQKGIAGANLSTSPESAAPIRSSNSGVSVYV
jgi:flagellar hook-length control protein FliK